MPSKKGAIYIYVSDIGSGSTQREFVPLGHSTEQGNIL